MRIGAEGHVKKEGRAGKENRLGEKDIRRSNLEVYRGVSKYNLRRIHTSQEVEAPPSFQVLAQTVLSQKRNPVPGPMAISGYKGACESNRSVGPKRRIKPGRGRQRPTREAGLAAFREGGGVNASLGLPSGSRGKILRHGHR